MQFAAILTSLSAALVLATAPTIGAYAQSAATARADDTLLQMNDAYRKRDRNRLAALLPAARGHVLEPWAIYWEMRARLESATADDIRATLARLAGTYQEDRLRNDWLLLLGATGDWANFMAEYAKFRMHDDRSVECYALLTSYNATQAPVADKVQDLWLAQRDADDACANAAAQQIKARKLDSQVAWMRARLGMENGRQGMAAQAVGILDPAWMAQVNAIYQKPADYLNEKRTALLPRTKEFVTLALIRLATIDPDEAADEANKLRWKAQLTQEERSWVWGVIGKRVAMRLSNDALAVFANGQDKFMHEDHLAWKVRAALRASNWGQVLEATSAMGEAQRQDPAWVYWRARALQATARTDAQRADAQMLLASIASVRGFYEQLALEDIGQKITTPEKPAPLTVEEKAAARANPGLQRGLYAIAIGLRSEGVREWNYSTSLHDRGGMDDRALMAAADLACEREVWDRCINTSERTKVAFDADQRFPMPHHDAVLQRTKQIALDPSYVYGLIRQESRFIVDARSNVGASGLMQVMPATARWTAKKLGMTDFKPQDISHGPTNIAIGTGYLKLVLDDFAGSMPLAAAAYNAGPGRPRSWRNGPTIEAAAWAENVPFTETRDYVKKVLSNATMYAAIITGQPQSLKARLGTIGPRPMGQPADDRELP